MSTNRRKFLKTTLAAGLFPAIKRSRELRPNLLVAIADDWSWPHAGIAGAKGLKTPNFDRLASEGVMFKNTFVSAPSCSPSRAALLTGQYHWRLEEGGDLWGTLPAKFDVYPDLLENAGYCVGLKGKGWGPGRHEPGGRKRNAAGPTVESFKDFLGTRAEGQPFCFWFGSADPHRPYDLNSGVQGGLKPSEVEVPSCLPDCDEIRRDICDYYWEVQRFDRQVGELIADLKAAGELDNTIVVMTSDNGLPFPRCKSNLYDGGTRVPLVIRWPERIKAGRVVDDFVHLSDLAPTFLEACGLRPRSDMTGKSLMDLLTSTKSGQIDRRRDKTFTGKERHAWVRANGLGYPTRAVRTTDFLYIRNFLPDRWPAGDPDPVPDSDPPRIYGDIDESPSKQYMMAHSKDPQVRPLFELAFGKRPAEELYDLRKDPGQLKNVAEQAEYQAEKKRLSDLLMGELSRTKDPRVIGGADLFDKYPYYGGGLVKR